MHVNTQIRNAVRDRLQSITALASVFTNRSADILDGALPAAVIQTTTDEVAEAAKISKDQAPLERRTISLTVVVVTYADEDDLDDRLDELRTEIEAQIGSDGTLGGMAKRVEHRGGDLELMTDEDGERWYAFLALQWEVDVFTERGNPEVPR